MIERVGGLTKSVDHKLRRDVEHEYAKFNRVRWDLCRCKVI